MIDIGKKLIERSLFEIFNKYGYGKYGMGLIKKIGIFAGSIGYESFLIGGFVRDVLIYSMKINPETSPRFNSVNVFNTIPEEKIYSKNRRGSGSGAYLDMDIVLEGNACLFAESLLERNDTGFAINSIKIHKRFGTASIFFLINGKPLKVDLASARTEMYQSCGALPAVSTGEASLRNDVFRRDFTINTLSFSLSSDTNYPENGKSRTRGARTAFLAVKDYAGGLSDILNKKIRVLHDLSFKDDPTRILRAVRFEKRLGFNIERHTKILIEEALEAKALDNVSGNRIMAELNLLLKEKRPWIYFARLDILGILKGIYPKLRFNNGNKGVFRRIYRFTSGRRFIACQRHAPPRAKTCENACLFYIAELLHHLNRTEFNAAIERLSMDEKFKKTVLQVYLEAKRLNEVRGTFPNKLYKNKPLKFKDSEIYLMLKGFSENGILFYLFKNPYGSGTDFNFEKWAVKYINKIRFIKPLTGGNDIKSLGICEGPLYGSILEEVKLLKMDGRLKSKRAEIAYIKNKYIIGKKLKLTKKTKKGIKDDRV
ncbi:MAG: hypothetical protein M1458_00090 [Deltaproteobacteria bacterium]|nr:hypothetical protein [Deltaproteobacteria bacterium]